MLAKFVQGDNDKMAKPEIFLSQLPGFVAYSFYPLGDTSTLSLKLDCLEPLGIKRYTLGLLGKSPRLQSVD
jgi:hypothetical protein